MACCSPIGQRIWLFGCGALWLIIAIVVGVLWPSLSLKLIYSRLSLEVGSQNYDNWIKTPFPLYMEFYMFNWTNADRLSEHATVKPAFEEIGPYIFEEMHERVDVDFIKNKDGVEETVFFAQKKWWKYRPDLSKGLLTDPLTQLNPVPTTMVYGGRYMEGVSKGFLDAIITQLNSSVIITKPVGEWLFDGIDDPILDWVQEVAPDLPEEIQEMLPPFDKFGFFYERNGSAEYDGNFTMYTGVVDIYNMGEQLTWKGSSKTGIGEGRCGEVWGTTGELWPPKRKEDAKNDITLFVTDFCRTVTLKYESDMEYMGIKGKRFIADESVFDVGHKYPETECWCLADKGDCPDTPIGVFNASKCQMGSPTFVSFPHFYLADESYLAPIEGLKPDRAKHEFFMEMMTVSGAPLNVNVALQVNMLLMPDPDVEVYKNVPRLYTPLFWFRNAAKLSDDLAKDLKVIPTVQSGGIWAAWGFGVVAAILIIAAISVTIVQCRRSDSLPLLDSTPDRD